MSKYFIDTEFIESGPGKPIYLLSLGVVAEDGRELYVVVGDAPHSEANDWVRENVLPHLLLKEPETPNVIACSIPFSMIADLVRRFIGDDPKPSFIGYYSDYDWVVFCQIFGNMTDLPEGWPMYCIDLKQRCVELGNPELPKQTSTEHNALYDARWTREAWEYVEAVGGGGGSGADVERTKQEVPFVS